MPTTLTKTGIANAVTSHPELTRRKAVSVAMREIRETRVIVKALGGAELTLEQVAAQFEAHWSLLRKQSGGASEGIFANAYSKRIVAETKAILDSFGVRKGAETVARAK